MKSRRVVESWGYDASIASFVAAVQYGRGEPMMILAVATLHPGKPRFRLSARSATTDARTSSG